MAKDTITIRKDDLWKYATFVLLAVVVIGGFFVFTGNGSTSNAVNNPGEEQEGVVKASIDDDAVIGDADAPVTVIEFSDYQCPFCRKFWTETLPSIKQEYIDTGKVRFVYRDLPLAQLHPVAQKSAEAAECVRDQGGDEAYFEMHDKMFAEQNILDSGSASGQVTKTVTYTEADLISWASELGYDISSCLSSGKFATEVQKDAADAQTAGMSGTPGFVIMKKGDSSGIPIRGAYPFSAFQQVIEAELAA